VPVGYFDSIESCKNAIRERYDIIANDEDTAQKLADNWNGILNKPQELQFIEGAIPVVLCSNDNWAQFLAVSLQSLLDNSNPKRTYHFIVFERGFSQQVKEYLSNQVVKFKHCKIDFINMAKIYTEEIKLTSPINWSIDIFSRLFIPWLLDKYPKVVYLDIDTLVKNDIVKLYDENINDFCIGASRDIDIIRERIEFNIYDYLFNRPVILFLDNSSSYFNTGVMIFNTDKFRKKINMEDLIKFSIYFTNRYNKLLPDQDILNIIIQNDYFKIPNEWNHGWPSPKFKPLDPNVKLIHFFTMTKPWQNDKILNYYPAAIEYKNYAKNVPLYAKRMLEK